MLCLCALSSAECAVFPLFPITTPPPHPHLSRSLPLYWRYKKMTAHIIYQSHVKLCEGEVSQGERCSLIKWWLNLSPAARQMSEAVLPVSRSTGVHTLWTMWAPHLCQAWMFSHSQRAFSFSIRQTWNPQKSFRDQRWPRGNGPDQLSHFKLMEGEKKKKTLADFSQP